MAQLDLWQADLDDLPWQGQSPRALTRIAKALFLRRKPQKDDSFFADPDQLELKLAGEKAPRILRGALLLVEPRWLEEDR